MERVDRKTYKDYQQELMRLRINKPEPRELRRLYNEAYHTFCSLVLDRDTSSPFKTGIGQYYAKKEACKTYAAEVGIDLDAADPPIDPAALR